MSVIFENMPLPLAILSREWEVVRINRAFSELFGEPGGGIRAGELFEEISPAPGNWNISVLLGQEKVAFKVKQLPSGDWLLIIIPESDGQTLAELFATQVAEALLDEVTSEPEAKFSELHEGQLALLGHLSGGVAHDLNNILTGVLGHLSLLRGALSEEHPSLVAAEEGARRACSTAQQVLEFVRGQGASQEVVDLKQVIERLTGLLEVSLPKNITLKTSLGPACVVVNEGELSQAIINLALNARDAMPVGGELFIHCEERDGRAVVIVRDTGTGIPDEVVPKLFEPFFTTKESGTGLGLSNVRRAVERNGGEISFSTSPNRGTEFRISLPLSQLGPSARKEEISSTQEGERVLVVEDEETVRIVMQRSLEQLGYQVDAAASGNEALQEFQLKPYDLVVLDIMMPEMPGDELFKKLRAIDPEIPVLIASGYSSDSRTKKMLQAGRCGYIQKPFGVEDLAAEVRRCIERFAKS
jgi:signal transduction histidine kinase/CheY-like chemotaxis protein